MVRDSVAILLLDLLHHRFTKGEEFNSSSVQDEVRGVKEPHALSNVKWNYRSYQIVEGMQYLHTSTQKP